MPSKYKDSKKQTDWRRKNFHRSWATNVINNHKARGMTVEFDIDWLE